MIGPPEFEKNMELAKQASVTRRLSSRGASRSPSPTPFDIIGASNGNNNSNNLLRKKAN